MIENIITLTKITNNKIKTLNKNEIKICNWKKKLENPLKKKNIKQEIYFPYSIIIFN